MSFFLQDLRHGVRLLGRTPGFTTVAVLVLALGIGANTAVFSIVNALLLQPQPGRVGELVGLFNRDRTQPETARDGYRAFSYPTYLDIRDGNDVFERLTAHSFTLIGVGDGNATRRMFASVIASNYFGTLGIPLAAGRAFSEQEEKPGAAIPVAVASFQEWRRQGFRPEFVGSSVKINGVDFTVVGVAAEGFKGTMGIVGPEWWFPLGSYDQVVSDLFREGGAGIASRTHASVVLLGILKPGITPDDAAARLDVLARRVGEAYPATDRDRIYETAPLRRLGSSTRPESDSELVAISGVLLLMSAIVLVVSCLNLANLMLARGTARRREIAVRMALGGGRWRIVRQLMTEAVVLSGVGGAFGLLIAAWSTRLLALSMVSSFPISVSIDASPDLRVIAVTAFFAVLSTMAFALAPAWSLSGGDLASDTKSDARGTTAERSGTRLGSGPRLIVAQLALSLVLVVIGGLFVRGALSIGEVDPGYALDRQIVASVDPSLAGFDERRGRELYRTLFERLRSLPGVASVSFASMLPFGEIHESRAVYQRGSEEAAAAPTLQIIGAEYFQTVGLRMLRGREFSRSEELADPSAAARAVINQPLARQLFGDADPVGRQIQIRVRTNAPLLNVEIIGVAPGLRHDLIDPAPVPHLYLAFGGQYRANMNFHIRADGRLRDEEILSAVSRELRQVESQLPILALRTMTAHRDTSFFAWVIRAAAGLFGGFGALALLLSVIGVYGLEAYNVSRRTREIGIRIALGARAADVARLVLGEGLRATLWGLGIGLVFALAAGRLVSGLLFRVSAFDPLVLTVAALTLAGAVLLACMIPLRAAVQVEPIVALRTE